MEESLCNLLKLTKPRPQVEAIGCEDAHLSMEKEKGTGLPVPLPVPSLSPQTLAQETPGSKSIAPEVALGAH